MGGRAPARGHDPAPAGGRPGAATAPLAEAFREHWPGVLATLARQLGDLQLAEDATQEAFAAATSRWPVEGVPDRPGAWLTAVARRRAIDQVRHDRIGRQRVAELQALADVTPAGGDPGDVAVEAASSDGLHDDRLRLIFVCAHPALALDRRVALTLRCVAGLTTAEIAGAFLVPEATMAQRLVRAKRKILEAGIPYEVPGKATWGERLDGVLAVVYLVFNEGYAASAGDQPMRAALCAEAVRLGRLLHALVPDDAETAGLLALTLLHGARTAARTGADGRAVPLAEQDRGRWDAQRIAEGVALLDAAMLRRRPGPYQIQAAIAALHAQAPSVEATDWRQIAALYGSLARFSPSPVVEVNRAVAVGLADGALAGLAVLEPVLAGGQLADYAPLHAAHADLLQRAGELDAAAAAWRRAAAATANLSQRAELQRRADRLGPG